MNGIAWAIVAGISFGLFQAVNRRANQVVDAFRTTFGLVVVGAVGVGAVALISQDLAAARSAPLASYLYFAAAGVVHFFVGWTLLALSQQRIGASRTGAVLASTPLIASVLAALVLDEALGAITWLGVLLVTAGVALLSLRGGIPGVAQTVPWFALAAAASWATSPLFIRKGLEGLGAPLVGVAVGLLAAAVSYAIFFAVRGQITQDPTGLANRAVRSWIVIAGVVVAAAIAAQWTAFDLAPIGVGYALMQLAAPVVIVAAPLIVGGEMERVTPVLILAVTAIVSGSVIVAITG